MSYFSSIVIAFEKQDHRDALKEFVKKILKEHHLTDTTINRIIRTRSQYHNQQGEPFNVVEIFGNNIPDSVLAKIAIRRAELRVEGYIQYKNYKTAKLERMFN